MSRGLLDIMSRGSFLLHKKMTRQISVIITNIDKQNKIHYNPTIPTIKYQITQ